MIGKDRGLRDGRPSDPECFTTIVVADLLWGQPRYEALVDEMTAVLAAQLSDEGLLFFFKSKQRERLPADADCTALGLSLILRYYHSPDTCLYFSARFARQSEGALERMRPLLVECLRSRLATTSTPLDLAQRVIVAAWLGVDHEGDYERLLALRDAHGVWPLDSLFRYGRRPVYFGSRALVLAFIETALQTGARE